MPKSRGRRKKPETTRIKLAPPALGALKKQRELFQQKFGRDWKPDDYIFFDPDADEPAQMPQGKMEAEIIDVLRKVGAPPEYAYAYKKTGLLSLGRDTMSLWPEDRREEWEAAVAEYHQLEDVAKRAPDKH